MPWPKLQHNSGGIASVYLQKHKMKKQNFIIKKFNNLFLNFQYGEKGKEDYIVCTILFHSPDKYPCLLITIWKSSVGHFEQYKLEYTCTSSDLHSIFLPGSFTVFLWAGSWKMAPPREPEAPEGTPTTSKGLKASLPRVTKHRNRCCTFRWLFGQKVWCYPGLKHLKAQASLDKVDKAKTCLLRLGLFLFSSPKEESGFSHWKACFNCSYLQYTCLNLMQMFLITSHLISICLTNTVLRAPCKVSNLCYTKLQVRKLEHCDKRPIGFKVQTAQRITS